MIIKTKVCKNRPENEKELENLGYSSEQIAEISNMNSSEKTKASLIDNTDTLIKLGYVLAEIVEIAITKGAINTIDALINGTEKLIALGYELTPIVKIAAKIYASNTINSLINNTETLKNLGYQLEDIIKIAENGNATNTLYSLTTKTKILKELGYQLKEIVDIGSKKGGGQKRIKKIIDKAKIKKTINLEANNLTRTEEIQTILQTENIEPILNSRLNFFSSQKISNRIKGKFDFLYAKSSASISTLFNENIPTPFVSKIKMLERLIQAFIDSDNTSVKNRLRLSIEFLLEEIGDRTEKLASFKKFNDTQQLSISKRYFNLLGICRRLMAHPPLNLDNDLLNYIARVLLLKTQVKLDEQVILNQEKINPAIYFKFREIDLKELSEKKLYITALLESLGFKSDFKIYNSCFKPTLGLVANLNILVEFDNDSDADNSSLLEAEIRLSQILNADIKVYTTETLKLRQKGMITNKHIACIKAETRTIEDILIQDKFNTMFMDKNWSNAFIPGIGRVNVSEYLNAKEIISLIKFITDKNINTLAEINELILTPSLIQAKIEEKLTLYNKQLVEFLKLKEIKHKDNNLEQVQKELKINYQEPLLNFFSLFYEQLIQPAILKYETIIISTEITPNTDNPYNLYTGILEGGFEHPTRRYPISYPARLVNQVIQNEDKSYSYCEPMYSLWNKTILNKLPQNLNELLNHPNNFRHLWQEINFNTPNIMFRGNSYHYLADPNNVPQEVDLLNTTIITMDQLWHLNNLIYEYSPEYNQRLYPSFIARNAQTGWGVIRVLSKLTNRAQNCRCWQSN